MPSTLSQQDFVRRLLEKKGLVSWLVGAGTSVSANMPTASDIVWDLKKRFYCAEENQEFQGNDIQVAPVREKIQAYLDSKQYPQRGTSEEYSFYFKLLFGDDYARQRDYLQDALNPNKVSISAGQRVLTGLLCSGYIPCLFSTNFDEVVEKSYARIAGNNLYPHHIEGSYAALDALNANKFPLYVKLHGDFRYISLKNLEPDLLTANEQLGKCFVQAGSRFGIVVAGYSGRDKSVMNLMYEVLNGNNPFPHGFYWAVRKGSSVPNEVKAIVQLAIKKNVQAHLVEIDDYVALMSAIWKQIPDKSTKLVNAVAVTNSGAVHVPLPPAGNKQPVIRFNCLPVQTLPCIAYRITPSKPLSWDELKEIKLKNIAKAIIFQDEGIYAWGKVEDIRVAFGDGCQVSEEDISGKIAELNEHKAVKGALEDALCKAIARKVGLIIKGRKHEKYVSVHVEEETTKFVVLESTLGVIAGNVPNVKVKHSDQVTGLTTETPLSWSEAVQIGLTFVGGCYVATIRPDIWISPLRERRLARDFIFKRTGGRKNDVLDKIVSAWIETIAASSSGESLSLSAFPGASAAGKAPFQLITRTSYSKRA